MGVYLDEVDWVDMAGNVLDNREDNLLIARNVNNLVMHADDPQITQPPHCVLDGPSQAVAGKPVAFDAAKSTDPAGKKLYFRWDLDDGTPAALGRRQPRLPGRRLLPCRRHRDQRPLQRPGVPQFPRHRRRAGTGHRRPGHRVASATQVEARDVMWGPQFYLPVGPVRPLQNPQGKVEVSDDKDCLVGHSSILVRVTGSAPHRPAVSAEKQLKMPLAGKTAVVFWSKYINPIVHAWQGMRPVVTLYETDQSSPSCARRGAIPLTNERTNTSPTTSGSIRPPSTTPAPRRRRRPAELDHHRVSVDERAADAGMVRRVGVADGSRTTGPSPAPHERW